MYLCYNNKAMFPVKIRCHNSVVDINYQKARSDPDSMPEKNAQNCFEVSMQNEIEGKITLTIIIMAICHYLELPY